jgi:hypothetical protein
MRSPSAGVKGCGEEEEDLIPGCWGRRIGARRWVIVIHDPQRSLGGCRDYYRSSGLIYAGEKAFFSLWKTS